MKKKGFKLYVKWKGYDHRFNSWIDKKSPCIKMSQYFPKPFNSHFVDSIKVKIDLPNYATKTDIKNISHVNSSSFTLKTNLA